MAILWAIFSHEYMYVYNKKEKQRYKKAEKVCRIEDFKFIVQTTQDFPMMDEEATFINKSVRSKCSLNFCFILSVEKINVIKSVKFESQSKVKYLLLYTF